MLMLGRKCSVMEVNDGRPIKPHRRHQVIHKSSDQHHHHCDDDHHDDDHHHGYDGEYQQISWEISFNINITPNPLVPF